MKHCFVLGSRQAVKDWNDNKRTAGVDPSILMPGSDALTRGEFGAPTDLVVLSGAARVVNYWSAHQRRNLCCLLDEADILGDVNAMQKLAMELNHAFVTATQPFGDDSLVFETEVTKPEPPTMTRIGKFTFRRREEL